MKENYFIFFSNCIPVYGVEYTAICDFQNGKIHHFDSNLKELIQLIDSRISLKQLENRYIEEKDGLANFLHYFYEKGIGMYTNEVESFPRLPIQWDHPSKVTNAILDFGIETDYSVKSILDELDYFRCKHIQLRFFEVIPLQILHDVLSVFKESDVLSIDLIFNDDIPLFELKKLYLVTSKINSVTIFNAKEDQIVGNLPFLISYLNRKISNEKSCGLITKEHLSTGLHLFMESHFHNNCLNRKISIDKDGNVKNCPSMNWDYGRVQTGNLKEKILQALNHEVTQIKKSEIEVCRECEFRMVCTDCRAYLEKPSDMYSKPLKCGYNPKTGIWEEWSTNPIKKDAIGFYALKHII
ncbi:grasp-with-spasm system SPASM domain peptide maturase [Fluviicola taffensis]|uniref:4Fe4S-binding SPASM domain-containing protein n=1 Tax=Fluviicola taffensis (strain DSM 16823 / NCIMB 13979 / RW262) TaxID=755732 RepID=F2IB11_FLUTR|nr:grasp-with-spasm system SPASM domain peptide maturase [Fluviicola taffensis]AEA45335.1 hypothetical protein Fluta_3363 [Fluviicola taffensis DSM 16823]